MAIVEVDNLEGAALDWAVAKSKGYTLYKDAMLNGTLLKGWYISGLHADPNNWVSLSEYKPTTDGSYGVAIIEQIGGFQLKIWLETKPYMKYETHIHNYDGDWITFGHTLLIAAMRCFVQSRLGKKIEVPDELLIECV